MNLSASPSAVITHSSALRPSFAIFEYTNGEKIVSLVNHENSQRELSKRCKQLPIMKIKKHTSDIIEVQQLWPKERCRELISRSEAMGYEQARVQTTRGQKLIKEIRSNQRVIFKDIELADELWITIKPASPLRIGNSEAIGLNELFRFYKYERGEHFRRHRDESYIRNDIEASYYTLLVYLNEEFEGGETNFGDLSISPKEGKGLIFRHDLEHEGGMISSGTKYVLRTDIMYRLSE